MDKRNKTEQKELPDNLSPVSPRQTENRTRTPNPYYMKGDISFQEKLNRVRNARLIRPFRVNNTCNKETKKTTNTTEDLLQEETCDHVDVTDIKHMQSLSDRLNRSQNKKMTEDERNEWYTQRGYEVSANGVLVTPRSSSPPTDAEAESIMKTNLQLMSHAKATAFTKESFVGTHHSSAFHSLSPEKSFFGEAHSPASDSSSPNYSESSESISSDEDDEAQSVFVTPDMLQKMYPARMEMLFLSSNFNAGNEILDMECYGNYASDSIDVEKADNNEESVE